MNTLTAEYYISRHVQAPHLVFMIDGTPLDEFLATRVHDDTLRGLVPTLLDWLENSVERHHTWTHILPPVGQTVIAPILMCPDDCDFWCTIIVAEIAVTTQTIAWQRLGRAIGPATPRAMPASILSDVYWFTGIPALQFDRMAYIQCVEQFQSLYPEAERPSLAIQGEDRQTKS